jgi:hypothetical protein
MPGGGYVDAGLYYGDGSFWVEGGAYPNPPEAGDDGGPDASTVDASTPCGQLAACCPTLTGGPQSLCNSVAAAGDATNCATELAQLQSQGNCTGVTILATDQQVPASRMVSDGTLLFWTTFESAPGLFAMPVQGGTVTTLLSGQAGNSWGGDFLAVDDLNVYVLAGNSLLRLPRNGAQPTLINGSGASVANATSLGGTAYWMEIESYDAGQMAIQSAPLQGSTVSPIAPYVPNSSTLNAIGVTASTAFLLMSGTGLMVDFPLTGIPASGPTQVNTGMGYGCNLLTSDTSAIYCTATASGSNLAIASDATITTLGQSVNSSYIAFDDTYVYWVDNTTVGTIKRAPKTGGGATILVRDTSPTAIAVDSSSIYWSDQQGYIKKIPK